MKTVYADNAATTALCPEALDAMVDCLKNNYGNASSLHHMGQEERQLFFQYSRPSGCDTSKLLSDNLKNKLYYDGFQKVLYHYSHHKTGTLNGLGLFFLPCAAQPSCQPAAEMLQ